VVAARPPRANPERKLIFAGTRTSTDPVAAGRDRSHSSSSNGAVTHVLPIVGANCSMVSDSPRAPAGTPAAYRTAAAVSAPPVQPTSAARSDLRRCATARVHRGEVLPAGPAGVGTPTPSLARGLPYTGLESLGDILDDLHTRWSGRRVMLIGHMATYRALERVINNVSLEDLVAAEFEWRETGWEYRLP